MFRSMKKQRERMREYASGLKMLNAEIERLTREGDKIRAKRFFQIRLEIMKSVEGVSDTRNRILRLHNNVKHTKSQHVIDRAATDLKVKTKTREAVCEHLVNAYKIMKIHFDANRLFRSYSVRKLDKKFRKEHFKSTS